LIPEFDELVVIKFGFGAGFQHGSVTFTNLANLKLWFRVATYHNFGFQRAKEDSAKQVNGDGIQTLQEICDLLRLFRQRAQHALTKLKTTMS
jgi:hypothetical protein